MREERDAGGENNQTVFRSGEMIGTTKYFYSKDDQRSVREVLDNAGGIVSQFAYDPFGQSASLQGSLELDFKFESYYFHPFSALSLTYFREYNPSLGRWLSRDPIGEKRGESLYVYVSKILSNKTDPFWSPGHWQLVW